VIAESEYSRLPFEEAVGYLRQKTNLGSRRWTDIWKEEHARSFVVAGAMKSELLSDFRSAVDAAIADGETIADFRKRFDEIVARHGWSYKGGRGWRTRVIYDTNVRMAYAAGRWQQMTDPGVLKLRPYLMYRHGDSVVPRPEHLAWDGLVLRADDPWWNTHYPPNGWGCKCKVLSLSRRDLERMGKDGPDTAPEPVRRSWVSRDGSRRGNVPLGIDPGFDYNVGKARGMGPAEIAASRAEIPGEWEKLTPGNWKSNRRPEQVPLDLPKADLAPKAKTAAEVVSALSRILGAEDVVLWSPRNSGGAQPVHVNAWVLGNHIAPTRARFLPLLPELIETPFEAWATFERHTGTQELVIRQRIIKAFRLNESKEQGLLLVANMVNGELESWTFIPPRNINYLQKQREGKLVYGRE